MSFVMIKSLGAAVIGCVLEEKYAARMGSSKTIVASPYNMASSLIVLSSWFALTPLILLVLNFYTLGFGMKVGAARKKYSQLAKDEGEENVDERYGLPNLYAQGTSKNARAMNCVQRAHQHIFENLGTATFSGMVGAVNFPFTAAVSVLAYSVGRIIISNDYAASEGDPSKRYSNALAPIMWYGLLSSVFVGMLSTLKMIICPKFTF